MNDQTAPATPRIPQPLFALLEEEIQLSRQFLELLEAEKTALTTMNMEQIIALSRRKENKLARLQAIDEALEKMIDETGAANGSSGVRLASLVECAASEEEAERLRMYRATLLLLREKILDRNLINKRFAEDTRGYLNDAISMITGALADQPMYGAIGMSRPSTNKPTLISREV